MNRSAFALMSRDEVRALANDLTGDDADTVETCVMFVCAETFGMWHGRGRAKMCRRLKNLPLSGNQKERLVRIILQRFTSGKFSEQFYDQLNLAIRFDRAACLAAAKRVKEVPKPYMQRYANWVLQRMERTESS